MPISEAKKRANKKWNDENLQKRYDRIQLVVPKGKKEIIQGYAKEKGISTNEFIQRAIDCYIKAECAGGSCGFRGGADSGIM